MKLALVWKVKLVTYYRAW